MEAGLDSLGALDLRNALAAHFAVDLPPTLAIDYPTLRVLAAFIADLLGIGTTAHAGTALDAAAPLDLAGIGCARLRGCAHPVDLSNTHSCVLTGFRQAAWRGHRSNALVDDDLSSAPQP